MSRILRPDSKGRITLGPNITHGISGYSVEVKKSTGEIILKPYVEIPASEQWIHSKQEAMASLKRGLDDAKAGRLVSRKIPKITED